jgi:RNA polymerase sigma-70 factor, ECF subfamily
LKRIKQERDAYVGTWLPEPLFTQPNENSNDIKTDLSIGFMYLLERLTPMERGVTILREAFDLQYSDIAEIFEIAEDNCRQYLSRAKKKLQLEKSRFKVDKREHEEILGKFLDACLSKNIEEIVDFLREDVTAYGDGGGKAPAILHPLSGKDNVLGLLLGGMGKSKPFHRMEILSANGFSCAAFYQTNKDTAPNILISIDIDDKKKITNIYYLANPEKLQNLTHINFN